MILNRIEERLNGKRFSRWKKRVSLLLIFHFFSKSKENVGLTVVLILEPIDSCFDNSLKYFQEIVEPNNKCVKSGVKLYRKIRKEIYL